MSQAGDNLVVENALGAGEWGGSCTCPDGRVYQVGDQNDACGSLSCEHGVSGECREESGAWSRRKVVCAQTSWIPAQPPAQPLALPAVSSPSSSISSSPPSPASPALLPPPLPLPPTFSSPLMPTSSFPSLPLFSRPSSSHSGGDVFAPPIFPGNVTNTNIQASEQLHKWSTGLLLGIALGSAATGMLLCVLLFLVCTLKRRQNTRGCLLPLSLPLKQRNHKHDFRANSLIPQYCSTKCAQTDEHAAAGHEAKASSVASSNKCVELRPTGSDPVMMSASSEGSATGRLGLSTNGIDRRQSRLNSSHNLAVTRSVTRLLMRRRTETMETEVVNPWEEGNERVSQRPSTAQNTQL
eukprot:CAMPEP_0119307084 /NCGR_PEP_ID=MMETSP1333-20130426/7680_1 /TAXON_ID=418940 /ORGANISM="Scyphosphaera apsteinii, Strain RCC1455" /LENGTH=352 /DNA_ID=CAMNT_0007310553 /DNA_START=93 /DNA_END=1151 /DNA_ORIENTATION=+